MDEIHQKLATRAFLPMMNSNRNKSRKVAYGPHRLGGIGVTHGYACQGADGIFHLLTHLRWKSNLGKVVLCVISQLKLLSGWWTCLLENPVPLLLRVPQKNKHIYCWHHLYRSWLATLRDCIFDINAKITIPTLLRPLVTQVLYVAIVDEIITDNALSEQELAKIIMYVYSCEF